MTRSLKEIGQQRRDLIVEMNNMHDKYGAADWTDERQTEFDEKVAQVHQLKAEIKRIELLDGFREEGNQVARPAHEVIEEYNDTVAGMSKETQAHQKAFMAWLSGGKEALDEHQRIENQRRIDAAAMNTDELAKGGFLVPEEYVNEVIVALKAYGGVRDVARPWKTDDGRKINWPTHDFTAEKGRRLAQGQRAVVQNTEVGRVSIDAHIYTSDIIRVSHQLLRDAPINMLKHFEEVAFNRIGRIQNEEFTTCEDADGPQGILTGASVGFQSGLTDAVSFDDMKRLEHSVNRAYRRSPHCHYMFNDNTLEAFSLLKDADGRPLWRASVSDATPDRINNKPYVINDDMPDIGAGNEPILFGDMWQYMVRDAEDSVMMLRFDDSNYMEFLEVGLMMVLATDARYISGAKSADGNLAIRSIKMAAA